MSNTPLETGYNSGVLGHGVPSERERLGTVERLLDPITLAALAPVALEPTARCLELGGGSGSIAYHLAELVPDGEVVVTDVDTSFLEQRFPNLRIVQHDLRRDPCPGEPFDLVHCRAVLEHLPQRRELVHSLRSWVRPGGHILLECYDTAAAAVTPYPLRAMVDALSRLMAQQIGTDLTFARRLPLAVTDSGFVTVDVSRHPFTIGDGGPGEAMLLTSIRQVLPALLESELLGPAELGAFTEWVGTPGNLDVYSHLCSVLARRPDGPD
ncbi:class I SAM-dependent methyltransferase [Pseudonocardia sp. TRM90224]|uniref:class I SAM-dependent methyltransferase n=1 Tax=Pseudonocardia sp. TRM90224 TaxID=2812678 RepID=UPI001E6194A2|nr:class I SAM-dependent methyltransferase [Pseudonocardia sp. TRM90224]